MASGSKQFLIQTKNHEFEGLNNESEKEWKGPFFFIQGADPQYGMIESFLEKKPDPKWDKEVELSKRLVEAINKMEPKPKFFVICGDLLDAYPEQEPERRSLQQKDFKDVFAELDPDIPLVCVCGNHDVGNTPTPETVQQYRTSFGDDYFSFWCGGVFFIVINSQYYWDRSLVEDIAAEHDQWLELQLSKIHCSGCKHAVIFQHIPWFLKSPDDEDYGIFTLKKENRMKMLEKFKKAGVSAIFCGHYHQNAGGFYGDMEQVVTSAIGAQLGPDKHGVRIVKALDTAIQHKYYAIEDLPSSVSF